MAEQTSQQPRNSQGCVVEFGDAYNRTITINALKLRVRGSFSLTKLAMRKEGARDVGRAMNQMPAIPGLRMALNFKARRYRLFDPLEKDPATLRRINASCKEGLLISGSEFGIVEEVKGALEEDEWKTLIDELCSKLAGESLTVVEGNLPTKEELEKMPGRRLFDPFNSNPLKPRYHDQQHEYAASLDRNS